MTVHAKHVQDLPRSVQLHLNKASIDATEALLLSFDAHWRWLEYVGELERFGLAQTSTADLSELFRSLCIGLPRVRGAELRHVGLPNGRAVDLHVFSAKERVHVLLLDVRAEVEKTRVWQQSAQETELRSYEKTREIRKQRVTLSSLKATRVALSWELALAKAQLSLIRHELLAFANADAMTQGATFARATQRLLDLKSERAIELSELATAINKRIPGQIGLRIESAGRFYADANECALGFLPLLMFAHARTGTNSPALSAALGADAQSIKLTVQAGMQDLSNIESAILWRHELPDLDAIDAIQRLSASQLALVLCADRQELSKARVTRKFESDQGLYLTMSLPLQAIDLPIMPDVQASRTRVALAVGARVCFLGISNDIAQVVQQQVQSRGLVFEQLFQPEALQSTVQQRRPQAIILDAALPGVGKLAFSLRAHGYSGLIIATAPIKAGAAVLSAFDSFCADANAAQIQRALFGS